MPISVDLDFYFSMPCFLTCKFDCVDDTQQSDILALRKKCRANEKYGDLKFHREKNERKNLTNNYIASSFFTRQGFLEKN